MIYTALSAKVTERLRKLLALTDAPNRHAAFSALMAMKALLAKHNLKMRDVPSILHRGEAPPSRDESWAPPRQGRGAPPGGPGLNLVRNAA